MGTKEHFYFLSADGKTRIHGVCYRPSGSICGVVQISHGMTEYLERYEAFAAFLNEHGFAVVGNDHLGHGTSIRTTNDYGFFGDRNGAQTLLTDLYQTTRWAKMHLPAVSYYLLGHSMGSFLARAYLCRMGEALDGVILLGTASPNKATLLAGEGLARILAAKYGWHHRSPIMNRLAFGLYNHRLQPVRTQHDWLSSDPEAVDAYMSQQRCTFQFSLNGYWNLFALLLELYRLEHFGSIPETLPVLFLTGKEDPVGNYGASVRKTMQRYRQAGATQIDWKFYPDARHELLQERRKTQVYEDILLWLRLQNQKKAAHFLPQRNNIDKIREKNSEEISKIY